MNPLISVMIGAYNAASYIGEAIDSVLAQDYQPLELIVVDDGSDDGTAEVVRGFAQVRYIFQKNAGNGAARNRAVEVAGGELFAFLDADDRFTPGKLTLQKASWTPTPDSTWFLGMCESSSAPSSMSRREMLCDPRRPNRCRGRHRT